MKRIAALLFALMMLLTAFSAVAEEDLLDRILARGYMIVGTEGTYTPNSYYDEEFNLVGFDVEVAAAIAEKLGVGIEYAVHDWASIFTMFDNGQIDTVINEVEVNEERALKYDFSKPYVYIYGAVLTAAENTDIVDFDSLNGKRAAQNATSTWGQRAESYGAVLVPVTGDAETFELILAGRADFSINAETAFTSYMNARPDAKVRVAFRTETPITQSVVPAPKGNERFIEAVNKALDELLADGTLAELSIKYFGADFTKAAE
ncbi:MAG: transporter substrate-binding domain-containing protein [Clostridia bacterium]|nr:transporter substrate-binding domain-containing protein [Clostridia bacterium]